MTFVKKISTFILFSLLLVLPVLSQNEIDGQFKSDRSGDILIHTDRQLYMAGEILWFKAYLMGDSSSETGKKKVLYTELIGPDQMAVSRVKLELQNGHASGAIELSVSLLSGMYELRCYPHHSNNEQSNVFQSQQVIILNKDLPILSNPLNDIPVSQLVEESRNSNLASANGLKVTLEMEEKIVGQRKLVTLGIITKNNVGQPVAADLSMSVSLLPPSSSVYQNSISKTTFQVKSIASKTHQSADLPGLQLQGRVIDESSGAGVSGIPLFLSFPGKVAKVYFSKSDDSGNFSFLLPKIYGQPSMIIQERSNSEDPLSIAIEEDFSKLAPIIPPSFSLAKEWKPVAERTMANFQIQTAYAAFDKPTQYKDSELHKDVPFYGHPDGVYHLDDYTRFPIPEFFFEIVSKVRVKGKYGSESLELINEWHSHEGKKDPLFLVDGVPLFDQVSFLKINNKLIESAEIVINPFWLNSEIFDGIIHLKSFEADARCFSLPESSIRQNYLGYLPKRIFYAPQYTIEKTNRQPDFRNTLFWNANVATGKEGKTTISFFTSDALGDYQIKIAGKTLSGKSGVTTGSLTVVHRARPD